MWKPLGYLAYIVAVSAVFLYLLFPAARIKDQAENYLNRQLMEAGWHGRISLTSLSPAFPPGILCYGLEIAMPPDSLLRLPVLAVYPALISFGSPQKGFSFRGEMSGGRFRGKGALDTRPKLQLAALHLHLDGIRISADAPLQSGSNPKVEGSLSGSLQLENPQTVSSEAALQLADGRLTLAEGFPLQEITFKLIEIGVKTTGRGLEITRGIISGSDLDGEISGSVVWQSPLSQSRLSLHARVRPHPAFFNRLRQVDPGIQFLSQRSGGQGIPLRIEGTLANPRFNFR